MAEKEKEKWEKVLTADMVSSEESDVDQPDVVFIKSLPWRADRVNDFFTQLDEKSNDSKGPQARRQKKRRMLSSTPSSRMLPSGVPKWALKGTP